MKKQKIVITIPDNIEQDWVYYDTVILRDSENNLSVADMSRIANLILVDVPDDALYDMDIWFLAEERKWNIITKAKLLEITLRKLK